MTDKLRTLLDSFGEELKNAPEVTEYAQARTAYASDMEALSISREYNVQTMMLRSESAKPEKDTLAIDSIQARLNELTTQMEGNATLKRFNEAEEALNVLITDINGALTGYISPDSGCSGSCSTCGGCH